MFQMNLIRFVKMFSYVFLYKSLQGLAQVNRTWLSLIVGYVLFNIAVNNFSVMLRRSHLFLGITSTFGELMSLAQGNNTPTRPRIEPRSPDPESDALTTRPVRPPQTRLYKHRKWLEL